MKPSDIAMPPGVRFRVYDELDSTNAEAVRAMAAGEAGPCWFMARAQSAGRGRRGAVWFSKPGNLYASLLLPVSCAPAHIPGLSFVAALAVHDAVITVPASPSVIPDTPSVIPASPSVIPAQAGIQSDEAISGQPALDSRLRGNDGGGGGNDGGMQGDDGGGRRNDEGRGGDDGGSKGPALALKWPNDVLLAGRKLAGILLETASTGSSIDKVVIGCGINIAHYPEIPAKPATCLAVHGMRSKPEALLSQLAAAFEKRLSEWSHGHNFAATRTAWLARANGVGRLISVRHKGARLSGIFETIDSGGALVLRLDDGTRQYISSGEISLAGS